MMGFQSHPVFIVTGSLFYVYDIKEEVRLATSDIMDASKIDIADLAEMLEERKNGGSKIALILGSRAGALFRSQDFPEAMAFYSSRSKSFSVDTNEIARFSECYALLKEAKKQEPSGELEKILNEKLRTIDFSFADECLAELVKQKIFKIIFSSNPDDLLYDAFTTLELKKNEDFVEFDFGRHSVEDIRSHEKRYACRVIKPFNDVDAFVYSLDKVKMQKDIALWVRNLVEQMRIKEVLVVGADLLWDHLILSALPPRLTTIFLLNEDEQEKKQFCSQYENVEQIKFITGGKGEYEKFLQMLYWQINPGIPPYRYELVSQLRNQVNVMRNDMTHIKDDVEKMRVHSEHMMRHLKKILQLLEEEER